MPPKSSKTVLTNDSEAKATIARTLWMLACYRQLREIVREVIQEENSGLREEIKRAISLIKTALNECSDKLREHEEGLNDLDTRWEAMETRYVNLSQKTTGEDWWPGK